MLRRMTSRKADPKSSDSRVVWVGGEYARVAAIDRERNLLTVEHAGGDQLTYDPQRLQRVTVYREVDLQLWRKRL